jgi:hypothetical protein
MLLPEIKFFPVNWTNGMKISAQDFTALDNAWQDAMRDARCMGLHDFRYGLLPTAGTELEKYPKFHYDAHSTILSVVECRAVTLGGNRIEITERNYETLKVPLQLPSVRMEGYDGSYDIIISVEPSKAQDAGGLSNDTPARHALTTPQYSVSVRAKGEGSGSSVASEHHLKIGEMELRNGRAIFLTETGEYIPPCLSIESHHKLRYYHDNFAQRMRNIQQNALTVMREVPIEGVDAGDARRFSERVIFFIAGELWSYQMLLPPQPPLSMVAYFKDFAQYIWLSIETNLRGTILKTYIKKFDLPTQVNNVYTIVPDHNNILPALQKIEMFLYTMEQFCDALRSGEYFKPTIGYEDQNRDRVQPIQPIQQPPVYNPQPPKKDDDNKGGGGNRWF